MGMNLSVLTTGLGMGLPATTPVGMTGGLSSLLGGGMAGLSSPLMQPINPLGMDFTNGIAGFQSISQQIASIGSLDAATMAQLNNPTANPFNPAQSSMISSIMQEVKSGKFAQMALDDKVKKAEEDNEEEVEDEEDKVKEARKERLELIKLQQEEAQLEMLRYLALNAKQQNGGQASSQSSSHIML